MPRVALTTWYHYQNYGTSLQVVGLNAAIKSLGHSVDVVNYVPHGSRYTESPSTDWSELPRFEDAERSRQYEQFIKARLSFTSECKDDASFNEVDGQYDFFVAGSDQVWSPVVFDPRYFLNYVTDNRKKIGYAPSTGVGQVSNGAVREHMVNLMSQFAHLSARESSGTELIGELTGRSAQIVLDPTLLLTRSEWRKLIATKQHTKRPEKYILCHFLGDNENAWKHAKEIARQKQLPLKVLPVYERDTQYGEVCTGVGPEQYFNLIDNASVVLTDSYHGLLFSIICSKPFYVFERFQPSDPISQNSRVYGILNLVEQYNQLIGYDEAPRSQYTESIDYKEVYPIINENRKESMKYLERSLSTANPLVSVIVPMYKVEEYIQKCLESIASQTYKHIEIIVVDDGSPDNARKIAEKFAQGDDRTSVYYKENGGLSSARNMGLDKARGEYVVFVDSDDMLAPNFVEYMLGMAQSCETNIAASLYSYNEYCDEQNITVDSDRVELYPADRVIRGIYDWSYPLAVWNKIYRRDFIEQHKLRFRTDLLSAEGMTFNIMALQESGPVAVGRRQLYYQTFNPNSATRSTDIPRWETCFDAYRYQRKNSKISNEHIERARNFHVLWNNVAIARQIVKAGQEKKHEKYLRKYIRNIRKGFLVAMHADISIEQKRQYWRLFVSPGRELAAMNNAEMVRLRESSAMKGDVMPWELPKAAYEPGYVRPKVSPLELENAQLKAELASHMSIKRSLRLLLGNIKRRIRYGKNR